ncbi:MAG: toll/interleukin-1 receptor domain-containing protein, partial [bacterium]
CKARLLEAVDRETDFERDFQDYPDSFVKIFGQDLADLRKVQAMPTATATRSIKKYISRRLYVAWGIGGDSIAYAQLFDRVDHLYHRHREQDFSRVIDLYKDSLWTRELEEYPLLKATRNLILQLEQEAESKATGQAVMKALTRPRRPDTAPKQTGGGGSQWEYDVALSFAGENRAYVDEVAELLKKANVTVFYDKYEQVAMWGRDLQEHLAEVYQSKARYVVMFVSEHYASKVWPTHERRSALARAITERRVSVLPARFDDTEIPGLLPTVGYIDLRRNAPAQLVELILQKIRQDAS